MNRTVALVSGHFVPSNLVGAQRARLWSRYLPEFGWTPIVVTGDPKLYEEKPDPDLELLVTPGLRVIHAPTLPTRPVRLVGDIGVRAFVGCYRVLSALAARREIDFVLVTIPSNFLAPMGRLIHRRYGLPFGIDYQDPWVIPLPEGAGPFSKAWASNRLARLLEPWSVKDAALVTGMAPGYAAGMLERNPEVAERAVVAFMPMGTAPEDFELVPTLHRRPFLFTPGDGHFHMVYAGALLPAGIVVLDAFLEGLKQLQDAAPAVAARLRVHFVGTGSSPDDPQGFRVLPRAQKIGVEQMVSEHPHRIGYVDALNHLTQSDAVLVLGSTERHYTPSKVFQGMLSRRPVFAMLHAESTAVEMIRSAKAGRVMTLTEGVLPGPAAVAGELKAMMEDASYDARAVDSSAYDSLSARESTRALARPSILPAVARQGEMTLRIGYLISHPIQYLTPLFRELANRCDLTVNFAHRKLRSSNRAGFGVAFEWDIDLLSGYRNEFLTNVARNPWSDNFWGCNTPEIGDRIARGNFDAFVVPGWALWSYWQAVMACRRNGVPVFVRGDSQLVGQRKGPLRLAKELAFSRMLRAFDGFLYVGQRNREYLRHYGVPEDRLFFSPHCVDNGAFRSGAGRARSQGISNGAERGAARRILFVGKLHPRKNPMDVLRAAEIVQRNGIAVEVAYAGSGELADSLDAFAKSAGLSVHFHGFVNQTALPAIYAAADVIVLPSSGVETWGLVVNEAMACGIPAVVSDAVGCGPDLIEPGVTGARFPLGDIAQLARAIETVLRLDADSTRLHVEKKIEAYSPAAAAAGILAGVEGLRRPLLPKRLKQRKD